MNTKILVGLFLLGALIILGIGTFYIEDWGLQLQKGKELTTRFKSVDNLEPGSPVSMLGVRVGKVRRVTISKDVAEQYPVEAVLWVSNEATVRADDTPLVKTTSIFGGKYVSIERGDPTARVLGDGDHMKNGQVTPDLPEVVAEAKDSLEAFKGSMTKAQKAIDNVVDITDKIAKGQGTIGKLVNDEQGYKDLQAAANEVRDAFKDMRDITGEVRNGKGLLNMLLKDEQLARDVKEGVENIRNAAKRADTLGEDLQAIAKDVREGKGTVGKLFQSDELYKDLQQMAKDAGEGFRGLRDLTEKVTGGEGTVGKLISSDEAYKSLMASLDNVKKITTDFAEAKGTLPKLIKDDELYKQFQKAVKGLQEALQDYREQSPIVTFTGVIFGAF